MNATVVIRQPMSNRSAEADLEVYAAGVAAMRARSAADELDPLGWHYQSRIHGNPRGTPRRRDEPADWSACQHGTWFFLPWHRMYLHQLERIIRFLTEVPAFALPYWDYQNAAALAVPEQFLDPLSSLHDSTRQFMVASELPPETWMQAGTFVAVGGADAGQQHLGEQPGSLELNPHNLVHGLVGGNMASFQSPLDPLFWVHHANIDRLWAVWAAQPDRNGPSTPSFLDTTFEFPDPAGRKQWRVREVLEPLSLGYTYAPAPVAEPAGASVAGMGSARRDDDRLTLLAASYSPATVRDEVEIDVGGTALTSVGQLAASSSQPVPLYLRLENVGIDSGDATSMWNVYIRTGSLGARLVGTIVPFGLAALTEGGGRQTLTFDITGLSDQLLAHPDRVIVSFEPVEGASGPAEPFYDRASLYTARR